MAVRFALSQEGVTTYSLPCDTKLWSAVLEAGERYRKMDEKEQERTIGYAREHGSKPLFPA